MMGTTLGVITVVAAAFSVDQQIKQGKEQRKALKEQRKAEQEKVKTDRAISQASVRRERAQAANALLQQQAEVLGDVAGEGGGAGAQGFTSAQGGVGALSTSFASAAGFNQAIRGRQNVGVDRTQTFLDNAARAQGNAIKFGTNAAISSTIFSLAASSKTS